VLQDASVSLLLDVLEIIPRRAARGILLAHVAETAGEFGELFTIGALAQPIDAEMIGLQKDWAREESQDGRCIVQRLFGEEETVTEDYLLRAVGGPAGGCGLALLRTELQRAAES